MKINLNRLGNSTESAIMWLWRSLKNHYKILWKNSETCSSHKWIGRCFSCHCWISKI